MNKQHQNLFTRHSYVTPETVTLSRVFFYLQLHLSLSLSTGGEDGLKEKRDTELIPVQSLNLLLKSIGATLTDVQDVVFKQERPNKHTHMLHSSIQLFLCVICHLTDSVIDFRLAFFELTFQFCTTQQLQWEVIRHYSKQVKHMTKPQQGCD